MLDLLWLVPAVPIASFLVLALSGSVLPRVVQTAFGVGSIGFVAVLAVGIAIEFLGSPPPGGAYVQELWTWMAVGDLQPSIALYLDPLSTVMLVVITVVGFLIHVYSAEHMWEDDGYRRFFAYMNLFVGLMLVLVLADNLLLLYLGWEGVGLCSYLLIGFWYREAKNGRAAQKAFIVTRIGDTAMAVGLFLLVMELGTLDIQEVQARALAQWTEGSGVAVAAAALLFAGAIGKSAQLPLQTWLPDAMAGPSPVSALIHAATMVTAGVYLVARTHTLFALAPAVLAAVAIVGLLTQLTAGISALHQRDIKRILAYSTISQLGYMFLGLGVVANGAAVYHLMTHACFKSTWFLAAGAVIVLMHHEHDISKMGGLGKKLPLLFWVMFFAGVGPFFSKDLILSEVWFSPYGGPLLWVLGVAGVFVTSLYLFRLLFVVFLGEEKTAPGKGPGPAVMAPLVVLATMSVIGAFVELPGVLGYAPGSPGAEAAARSHGTEVAIARFVIGIALFGIYMAYRWYVRSPHYVDEEVVLPFLPRGVRRFFRHGWGFDHAYDVAFVRPFRAVARINRSDFVDGATRAVAAAAAFLHRLLARTQSGRLRWYAAGLALGTVIALGVAALR